MPVFNKMVYNGTEYILGGGGNIGEPLNLTVTTSGLDATITWEDNEIGTIPPTTFQKSELVRKIGSAPTSPSDGTLVVTETVKDTYKTTGYVDQGLTFGETYYYRVFSYSDLGGISYCDAVNATMKPGFVRPSSLQGGLRRFDNNMNDTSGNGNNGTGTANYVADRNGVLDNAYYAEDVNYYVTVANSSDLLVNNEDFSLGFWIKPDNQKGVRNTYGIISQTQNIASNPGWSIHYDSISRCRERRTKVSGYSSQNIRLSNLTWGADEWFHFIITYHQGTLIYYKNGQSIGSVSYTPGNCASTDPLDIGYSGSWGASAVATYQDVFFMKNKCLSTDEINKIYTEGFAI